MNWEEEGDSECMNCSMFFDEEDGETCTDCREFYCQTCIDQGDHDLHECGLGH